MDSTVLDGSNFETFLKMPYDWKCVLVGGSSATDRGFFLGMGRSKMYFMRTGGQWERTDDKIKFDLPANTLIYAEIVQVASFSTLSVFFLAFSFKFQLGPQK
jgi:hypothetical protein